MAPPPQVTDRPVLVLVHACHGPITQSWATVGGATVAGVWQTAPVQPVLHLQRTASLVAATHWPFPEHWTRVHGSDGGAFSQARPEKPPSHTQAHEASSAGVPHLPWKELLGSAQAQTAQ